MNNIGIFGIPSTAIRVLTAPSGFFRGMPQRGGFMGPLVFMIVMGVFSGLLKAAISILEFKILAGIGKVVVAFVFVPVTVSLLGFVAAAVLFVIWRLMGSKQSYQTSYRCVAYMSALMPVLVVVSGVPFWGGLVGIALVFFLIVIVSTEVHGISLARARFVFAVLALLLIVMYVNAEHDRKQLALQRIYQQQGIPKD
ncbi:membrane protein containing Yip1 domain protein [Candidatus Magnetobacterium bavaricum]|uniref:Membrane protein containing Yip1 domain protein n=1 Tax=Candidatus Magnetobacterium bavaricum TaxID=29290 RepID=A0A0F3GQU7_9BACT|nr:membrane protein containing Yip1 domain protein [Candidatus Magnetobacterium bavaricum]